MFGRLTQKKGKQHFMINYLSKLCLNSIPHHILIRSEEIGITALCISLFYTHIYMLIYLNLTNFYMRINNFFGSIVKEDGWLGRSPVQFSVQQR